METQLVSVQIVVRSDADKKTSSVIKIMRLLKSSRGTLALKTLAMFWGGAMFSILIPIVHFISVPSGLIAGVFMAWRAYGFENRLLESTIKCPYCQKEMDLKQKAFNWPLREECLHCRSWLLIRLMN